MKYTGRFKFSHVFILYWLYLRCEMEIHLRSRDTSHGDNVVGHRHYQSMCVLSCGWIYIQTCSSHQSADRLLDCGLCEAADPPFPSLLPSTWQLRAQLHALLQSRPLCSITAKWVIKALSHFLSALGVPKVLQSDRGSNFTSKWFPQALQQLCLLHSKRSRGAVRCFHRTLTWLWSSACAGLGSDRVEEGLPWLLLSLCRKAHRLVQDHVVKTSFLPLQWNQCFKLSCPSGFWATCQSLSCWPVVALMCLHVVSSWFSIGSHLL